MQIESKCLKTFIICVDIYDVSDSSHEDLDEREEALAEREAADDEREAIVAEREAALAALEASLAAQQVKLTSDLAAAKARVEEANKMADDSILVAVKHSQEKKSMADEVGKLFCIEI